MEDVKFINLTRKLHKVERRIQDSIPTNIHDVPMEYWGYKPSKLPYQDDYEDMLGDELQRVEHRRLIDDRYDVYQEL